MAGRIEQAPPPPRTTDAQPTADERVVPPREVRQADAPPEPAVTAATNAVTAEAARQFGIGGVVNTAV
jgi:hypothetical protein